MVAGVVILSRLQGHRINEIKGGGQVLTSQICCDSFAVELKSAVPTRGIKVMWPAIRFRNNDFAFDFQRIASAAC
jgi:hypothetical protein